MGAAGSQPLDEHSPFELNWQSGAAIVIVLLVRLAVGGAARREHGLSPRLLPTVPLDCHVVARRSARWRTALAWAVELFGSHCSKR